MDRITLGQDAGDWDEVAQGSWVLPTTRGGLRFEIVPNEKRTDAFKICLGRTEIGPVCRPTLGLARSIDRGLRRYFERGFEQCQDEIKATLGIG